MKPSPGSKLAQGLTKTSRRVLRSTGTSQPTAFRWGRTRYGSVMGGRYPRADSQARSLLGQPGMTILVVFIPPARDAKRFGNALASWQAATETIEQTKLPPQNRRGSGRQGEASKSREPRRGWIASAQLVGQAVEAAKVLLRGWCRGNRRNSARPHTRGGNGCAHTLYPKFAQADKPGWAAVLAKARDGAPDALEHVGHSGDVLSHPVVRRSSPRLEAPEPRVPRSRTSSKARLTAGLGMRSTRPSLFCWWADTSAPKGTGNPPVQRNYQLRSWAKPRSTRKMTRPPLRSSSRLRAF